MPVAGGVAIARLTGEKARIARELNERFGLGALEPDTSFMIGGTPASRSLDLGVVTNMTTGNTISVGGQPAT
ncbi:MAG TPA: hypothetical protein VEB22_05965, partial [Phycisphaerales bacterium]|nr:hypothetical protein [Phycisphaerales bacterium]